MKDKIKPSSSKLNSIQRLKIWLMHSDKYLSRSIDKLTRQKDKIKGTEKRKTKRFLRK
jgi:hypothetical protein